MWVFFGTREISFSNFSEIKENRKSPFSFLKYFVKNYLIIQEMLENNLEFFHILWKPRAVKK